MKTMRFSVALCLLAACVSPIASAQDDDDDDIQLEDDRGNRIRTTTTRSTSTTTKIPGTGDHQFVVEKVGVGFMGIQTIAIFNFASGEFEGIEAPTIGARYWFDSTLAVEAGLGLNIGGFSAKANKDDPKDFLSTTQTGIAFRVGVPISLYDSQHYSFQIIPDFRFAYGKESSEDPSAETVVNVSTTTTTWGVGASAGAEIYFGFMDIPELSVQAGVGFDFSHSSASVATDPREGAPDPSASLYQFATNLDGAPWNIFTGSVRALYYF
jgi:hypothetical protein